MPTICMTLKKYNQIRIRFINFKLVSSYLEFSVIGTQKRVKTAILHVLGDDHDRSGLGHHTLEEDHVGVLELTHDRGLGEEVGPGLVAGAWLQGLDGHQHVLPLLLTQAAAANIPELSSADDCLDGDVTRILRNYQVRKT